MVEVLTAEWWTGSAAMLKIVDSSELDKDGSSRRDKPSALLWAVVGR